MAKAINSSRQGPDWVDFREVKDSVTMKMVLSRYGVLKKLKNSGYNLVGVCPIHRGSNSRQFSVNPKKNIWHCFGDCKQGGNVLDFTARMENVSLRRAALLLQDWFLRDASGQGGQEKTEKTKPDITEKIPEKKQVINPPLKFRLKTLKTEHPFFSERGIQRETIKHFGLGYSARGIMKDRIAIPIHNERGELIAYCGRAVTDEQTEREGKYKLPQGFVKSAVVYNLNRQGREEKRLILVESFLSVFHLCQLGLSNSVSILGSELSGSQEELIVNFLGPDGQVILMFDADEAGRICTSDSLSRLGRRLFVKAADTGKYARKPHQLTAVQLSRLI